MKIETNLTFVNMKKNIKRMMFTIMSIILCSSIIFIVMLLISSIKDGISRLSETEYNDYHFIIKNLDMDGFDKIKDKEYIEKIYIEDDNKQLEILEKPYQYFSTKNSVNVYIKYNNVKKICNYSTDIIQTLYLFEGGTNYSEQEYEFNQKLLTTYGLIDVEVFGTNESSICRARVNYSYVLDIILLVILVVFSILFVIILYNAFLITINERKKQYAILNSIGGTEGQILKMILLEGTIIGILGIAIGGIISFLSTSIILRFLNNILSNVGYNFRLIFDVKYMALSVFIIMINIYISAIIPTIKASTASIIQDIRNNKQIKHKKENRIIDKILPIEGTIAIKNIKRNKNKYRIITILLVVCMISYIAVSTYINYEKVTAELVSEYDVDAKLNFDSTSNIDYKDIINDYEVKYGNKIEYMEYKMMGLYVLVEPENILITDNLVTTYEDNKKSIQMIVIGLDDKTYENYIDKLNANYGDFIVYNTIRKINGTEQLTYEYSPALETKDNFKLSVITTLYDYERQVYEYEIIDDENLLGSYILTDELIDGYKELSTKYGAATIFVNMDTYNRIDNDLKNYIPKNKNSIEKWIWNETESVSIKIKCQNIIEFSNYIDEIKENKNIQIDVEYYTLKNQEKLIYIEILQLMLKVIIIAVIAIGIISTINIINASLCERKQEFTILYSLGADKGNINRILIYECVYMFIKVIIISIILSIPILYGIIKYMENIIVLNKLLIPFGNICVFFIIIFLLSLIITLCSSITIKNK